MVELFTQEEQRAIMSTALDAVKGEAEEARRRGDVGITGTKTEKEKIRSKIVDDVIRTVRTNVVNTVLSFIPREFAAGITTSAFFADISRRLTEAAGLPADVAAQFAKAGGVIGAAVGVGVASAQRSIKLREQQRLALIAAKGPFISPETTVIGGLNFDEQFSESKEKMADFFIALSTGRGNTAKDIATFLVDKGRAGAAAVRAYNEALAEGGITNFTFAKTAAEEEFNKQVGRIPIKIYRAYSVLHERANAEFERFAKDPPLKG